MSAVIQDVNQGDAVATPKRATSWGRKLRRFLLGVIALLLVSGVVAHFAFVYSGSSKWELMSDTNGVKVYSMKIPGQSLEKFLAVFKVKSTLGAMTTFMQDYDAKLDVNFYGGKELQRHGPQATVTTWKGGFPAPFKDRDFVSRNIFIQDPQTKSVLYVLQALPDLTPTDDCCVRVRRSENTWLLTPQKNGEIEVRWTIDMDLGGALPYIIANLAHPDMMAFFAAKMQGYLERPKYINAKADWLVEPTP
ncbi:hypothetical protein GCN74_05245 [Janthinobacterium sp. FT14W]|uniref:START domain-containing protein n=1 Tax=Janthinobacterium sp. FT14W TaxID=2654253 RepID=UPI0012651B5B|nr:START domain-containing protein [Janthinobacterium sp. FT14W]KAB8061473.1 hypothetical protein GCN74_05245 [Janthinobacterium sp. FT14W]